jgi:hypothetical protein
MTDFEVLTLLLSCLAVALSLYTLREQRKLQREANELQRPASALAKRQLADAEQAANEPRVAEIEVELRRERASATLCVGNVGTADALGLDLELELPPEHGDIIAAEERARRLPIDRLKPFQSALIPCNVYYESPPVIHGHASWRNPDGTESRASFKVLT